METKKYKVISRWTDIDPLGEFETLQEAIEVAKAEASQENAWRAGRPTCVYKRVGCILAGLIDSSASMTGSSWACVHCEH